MEGHLHELSSSGWSLWRWLGVRGAGFPADAVLALAAPDAATALDRVLDRERELATATARAITALEAELDARPERDARAARRAIASQVRRLRAGEAPDPAPQPGPAAHAPYLGPAALAALEARAAAARAHDDARAAAEQLLAAERLRIADSLRATARDPRFREALTWQNRRALHTGVDALLREAGAAATSKARQHEQLVASHLQRYCVKNDTIGFFGPVGWARLGDATAIRPGPALLSTRTVYFELWGIDALATALAVDPRLRSHLAPRRHPAVWLEGTTLHFPIDRTAELPPEYARLLAACDGRRSAREIAAALLEDPAPGLASEEEVFELLGELVAQRAAIWTLEVPPHVEHPDRALAALLDAVPDPDAAAPGKAALARLTAARDAVAGAAGDPAALDAALARLEATFTQTTEAAPTRRAGETYAGRTLVYEDCRRDLTAELGPAVLDHLAAPLALLLASARWFTATLAMRYRETFVALHAELARAIGSPSIDFLRFWQRASEHFSGHDRRAPPLVAEVAGELQRRWAALLGLEGAALARPRLEAAPGPLAREVAALFAAPCPGWPSARHHSPDLMLAARGADALARGELTAVLGELHVATATVAAPWLSRQHPSPGELAAALARDRPGPILEAVVSKERAGRADWFSILGGDLDLELGAARSRRPRAQVVEAGALVVEPTPGSLRVRTRDGARTFALEQLLDSFLTNESTSHFKLLPAAPHCPRVSLGGLVIHRESWRFDAARLAFAQEPDPLDRLLAARRWALAHRLPRLAFYKIPEETKPCYLDLDSPHYVEQLAHLARKASELAVSEMLPAVDEAWLPDAAGARYACELRIVAVDPEPWRPAP